MDTIFLKPNRDEAVKRLHPWIFSGAIARIDGTPQDGDVVEVCDHRNNYLATGHFYNGSIAVKIFRFFTDTYEPTDAIALSDGIGVQSDGIGERLLPDVAFWQHKLQNAKAARSLLASPQTNCYRLVHGEGDGLPGLIIDFYDGVAVLQAHSIGMYRSLPDISLALQAVYGADLRAIYNKSSETLPDEFAKSTQNGYLFGACTVPHPVLENGHTFLIDWETGQKTGFFIDQRDNRALLGRYATGKRVLNAFCYSGGFSVYALAAGATSVHSVDASKRAVELVERNVAANFGNISNHQAYAEDVLAFLKRSDEPYDVLILDPPAYAKTISARHRAVQGYKRLNAEGIRHLKPNGILFTFSCSQVVDRDLFYNTVVSAALEVGRQVRVLHQLTQAPDHPVNFFHPEGSYLKGLVLLVE